ncbi:hypothetical protein PR048_021936 [Dryococelus australis]|uniref:Uncharacterized protein n=1 Tax=Dryococelus australis TaxID=614101 RepID=A0ABQ9GZN9_9NEOP|nr:hypothetical protein PR048_021936 [Dryococelus australis]
MFVLSAKCGCFDGGGRLSSKGREPPAATSSKGRSSGRRLLTILPAPCWQIQQWCWPRNKDNDDLLPKNWKHNLEDKGMDTRASDALIAIPAWNRRELETKTEETLRVVEELQRKVKLEFSVQKTYMFMKGSLQKSSVIRFKGMTETEKEKDRFIPHKQFPNKDATSSMNCIPLTRGIRHFMFLAMQSYPTISMYRLFNINEQRYASGPATSVLLSKEMVLDCMTDHKSCSTTEFAIDLLHSGLSSVTNRANRGDPCHRYVCLYDVGDKECPIRLTPTTWPRLHAPRSRLPILCSTLIQTVSYEACRHPSYMWRSDQSTISSTQLVCLIELLHFVRSGDEASVLDSVTLIAQPQMTVASRRTPEPPIVQPTNRTLHRWTFAVANFPSAGHVSRHSSSIAETQPLTHSTTTKLSLSRDPSHYLYSAGLCLENSTHPESRLEKLGQQTPRKFLTYAQKLNTIKVSSARPKLLSCQLAFFGNRYVAIGLTRACNSKYYIDLRRHHITAVLHFHSLARDAKQRARNIMSVTCMKGPDNDGLRYNQSEEKTTGSLTTIEALILGNTERMEESFNLATKQADNGKETRSQRMRQFICDVVQALEFARVTVSRVQREFMEWGKTTASRDNCHVVQHIDDGDRRRTVQLVTADRQSRSPAYGTSTHRASRLNGYRGRGNTSSGPPTHVKNVAWTDESRYILIQPHIIQLDPRVFHELIERRVACFALRNDSWSSWALRITRRSAPVLLEDALACRMRSFFQLPCCGNWLTLTEHEKISAFINRCCAYAAVELNQLILGFHLELYELKIHTPQARGGVAGVKPTRVIEMSMEQRRNERAGKREIPEKTSRPTASSGTKIRSEQANRSATVAPGEAGHQEFNWGGEKDAETTTQAPCKEMTPKDLSEVTMKQRRNVRAGKTKDPRENGRPTASSNKIPTREKIRKLISSKIAKILRVDNNQVANISIFMSRHERLRLTKGRTVTNKMTILSHNQSTGVKIPALLQLMNQQGGRYRTGDLPSAGQTPIIYARCGIKRELRAFNVGISFLNNRMCDTVQEPILKSNKWRPRQKKNVNIVIKSALGTLHLCNVYAQRYVFWVPQILYFHKFVKFSLLSFLCHSSPAQPICSCEARL